MEEDFPRGGREPKIEEEEEEENKRHHEKKNKRSLEEEGDDFLFGTKTKDKKRKKSKKDKDGEDQVDASKHSLLPLGGGGVVMKKKALDKASKKRATEPFIEALGFSRLAKGTKLLGIVREVQDDFALVSLPNLLTGYVLRTEVGEVTAIVMLHVGGDVFSIEMLS